MAGAVSLAILAGSALSNRAGAADPRTQEAQRAQKLAARKADFEKNVLPILENYCFDCHGDGASKGDLAIDQHLDDFQKLLRDHHTWKVVMHNVETKVMPPPKRKDLPSEEERKKLVTWIEKEIFRYDCNHPDPGRVTLRRLNRAEYNNTIRDLTGVKFRPADDFPADDSGYGFDNIGDVLSLSPVLFEKYLKAAEKVMDQAIRTAKPSKPKRTFDAERLRGGNRSRSSRVLATTGEVFAELPFPGDGEYRITIRAGATQGGDELARLDFRIDGKTVRSVDVPQHHEKPGTFEWKGKAKAGKRRVGGFFPNDFYDPKARDPNRRDRNLFIHSITVEGPLHHQPGPPSDFHRRYIDSEPVTDKFDERARKAITEFAARAWRRPVGNDEVEKLMAIASTTRDEKDYAFEKGVQLAFTAVLTSPSFLFRGELQPNPDNPKGNHLIDEHALASRLSYFLWSSTPDDELRRHADAGTLRKNLRAQVERMLNDWKAGALTRNFAGQWLQLRNMELVTPDRRRFREWNGGLAYDMRKETEMLFEHIAKNNRSVLEFLTADYTFVNERLARHYGIEEIRGSKMRQVSLKGTPRGGILTHGSILTLTSNPTRTSPVKRGKWVLDNILGTPPPEAPPNVPNLVEKRKRGEDVGTVRERLEAHREDPNCAACHALMDPIGFALENYDAVGRWRDEEDGKPVETAGQLVSGEKFANAVDLRTILSNQKGADFVRCMSEMMLTYALGRGLEFYDKCAVKEITGKVSKNGHRFTEMVMAVVESVPFQYRRGDGERSYDW